jgi:dipeptidyl aminopeptidase/acylaminoacyl peptidase
VEFFAPVLPDLGGLGTPGKLSHAQIHHGKKDKVPGTEFANAGIIEGLLKGEGTTTKLWGYPNAGHGFVSASVVGVDLGGTDSGNAAAQTKSRARTLKFFATHLR